MTSKFDFQGYPCEARQIRDDVWFYVQKEGVVICHRMPGGNPGELVVFPWPGLKQALLDHGRASERKKLQRRKR